MSIASNITALVSAIATAINSRGAAGASDYQMWLAQGNTGDMAAYRTSILGGDFDWATQFTTALGAPTSASADTLALFSGERRGTDAQRLALTTAQKFDGLLFNTTDTGITWKWMATPTTGVARWFMWDAQGLPFATYGGLINGGSVVTGQAFEASMSSGELTLNFAIAKSGGVVANLPYFFMQAGFRPAATLYFTGVALAPTSGIAAMVLDTAGNLYEFFTLGTSGTVASTSGTITFRPLQ